MFDVQLCLICVQTGLEEVMDFFDGRGGVGGWGVEVLFSCSYTS